MSQDGQQATPQHVVGAGTSFSSWLLPSSSAASVPVTPGRGARELESGLEADAAAPSAAGSSGLGTSPAGHDARDHASARVPAFPASGREGGMAREQGQESRLGFESQGQLMPPASGDATRSQQHAGPGSGSGTRMERRGSRERHSGGSPGPQASAEALPGTQGPSAVQNQSNLYQLQLQQQLQQLQGWPPGSGTKRRTPSGSPTAAAAQQRGLPGTPFAQGHGIPGSKHLSGWARLTCSTAVALAAICLAISLINLVLTSSAPSLFLGMVLPDPPSQQPGEQHLLERLSHEIQKHKGHDGHEGQGHGDSQDSPDMPREGKSVSGQVHGDAEPGGDKAAAGKAEERGKSKGGRGGDKRHEKERTKDMGQEEGKGGRKDRRGDKDKGKKEEQKERRGRQKGGDEGRRETKDKGEGERGSKDRDKGRGKGDARERGEEGSKAGLYADDPAEARSRAPLSASCNVSDGRWIRDDSYPLWRQGSCLLDQAGFSCQRPATYAPYRWQPRTCNIPRFVADDVRARLRGRRLAFVGDSLARNQFQSAVCMLAAGLPNGTVTNVAGNEWGKGAHWVVYKFHDFNFTVEFILSHYQVPTARRNNDTYLPDIKFVLDTDTVDWAIPGKLMKLGHLESLIAVFNAGHWYTEGKLMKRGIFFQVNGTAYTDMPLLEGYRAALRTLAGWMQELQEKNVTTVWRTYVPTHFLGGAWDTGGSCRDKAPMPGLEGWKEDQVAWMTSSQEYLAAMLEAARSVPRPPLILDVTHMSLLRSDAHIGEFAHNKFDCSHWCMPGVPDIWNELMFATLKLHGLL